MDDDISDPVFLVKIPAPADSRYFGRALAFEKFDSLLAVALWNTTTQHNQVNVYKARVDSDQGKAFFDLEASLTVSPPVRSSTTALDAETIPSMAMSMSFRKGCIAFNEGNLLYVIQRGDAFNKFDWKLLGEKPIDLGLLDDGAPIARLSVAVIVPSTTMVVVHAASATGESGFFRPYTFKEETMSFELNTLFDGSIVTDFRGELVIPNQSWGSNVAVTSLSNNVTTNGYNGKVQLLEPFRVLDPSRTVGPALETQVADRASSSSSSALPWNHMVAVENEHKIVAVASGTGVIHV